VQFVIRYECDKCGAAMVSNDSGRFIVKIEVYAAAGPVELDLEGDRDIGGRIKGLIEQLKTADPDKVEDQTYRALRFDLCDTCRRRLLEHPLGEGP